MSSMNKKICEQLKIMAENIKFLRLNTQKEDGKVWTQQDVADAIGVRYQSYQAYERGIAVPTLQNFLKLAELFDVSLDYLVGKKEF